MCGRYVETRELRRLRRLMRVRDALGDFKPRWNVAPGMQSPVVRRHPETGERHLDLLSWGFIPGWTASLAEARKPINARAETLRTSPMFKGAFAKRRAVVPADAFYEWARTPHGKQPYAFARVDGEPLALAAIWEGWRAPDGGVLRTFAIITTAANATMAPVHDRMPVILEPADWPAWLGEAEGDPAMLVRPAAEGVLRAWPVSSRVNTPRNDDARLLEPVPAADAAE